MQWWVWVMSSKGETLSTIANTNFQINHASHTVYFSRTVYSITQFWQLTFASLFSSLSLFIGFNRHLTSSIHTMFCIQCSHNSNNYKSNYTYTYTYTHSFVRYLFQPLHVSQPAPWMVEPWPAQCTMQACHSASQLTIDQNDIAKGAQLLYHDTTIHVSTILQCTHIYLPYRWISFRLFCCFLMYHRKEWNAV